jgi:hypothetical protein
MVSHVLGRWIKRYDLQAFRISQINVVNNRIFDVKKHLMVPIIFEPLAQFGLNNTEVDDTPYLIKILCWDAGKVDPVVMPVQMLAFTLMAYHSVTTGYVVVARYAMRHCNP